MGAVGPEAGVLAQLGVGGALVVVVAYAMIHIFKLFISHWNKQETDRTDAYKASAKAHAEALHAMGSAMERMADSLGDKVINAFGQTTQAIGALTNAVSDVKVAVGRLEGKVDGILDERERTPVNAALPERAPSKRPRTEPSDR